MSRKGITIGDFSLPGWNGLFNGNVDDGTIAVTLAMLLFLIPAKDKTKGCVMNWEDTAKLPWGIALLFGGGFALAQGMQDSMLDIFLGEQFKVLSGLPPVLLIAGVCAGMTALSEVATNIAAVEMTLPIFAATAVAIKLNPLYLMVPATVGASFGFMLPVATAANAIAFGTQKITMNQMVRTGFLLDVLGVILATFFMLTLGMWVFGIDPAVMPEWAVLNNAP